MAIYRNIQMTFWTDPKVVDEFTPEDKYFYLYLFTNPHTNLCGCYEVSTRQMAYETGYDQGSIERLIKRFGETHKVLSYSKDTREILLINWHKYNWTSSEKLKKPLLKEIEQVKNEAFKRYLIGIYEGHGDTVSIPYSYGMDTTVTVSVTDTVADTDTVSATAADSVKSTDTNKKHRYGEYKHVSLTDEEFKKLVQERGQAKTEAAITFLDEYLEMNGKSYKSCYLALRKWVFDAVEENKTSAGKKAVNKVAQQLDDFYTMASEWAERG